MLKKYWFSLILVSSFALSCLLTFLIQHPLEESPDSYSYDNIAVNLVSGHGYTDENYKLTMEREPVYPFFLALVYFIFGHNYPVVQLIQILLFLITLVYVYKIALIVFDEIRARWAFTFTAFFPTLLNYPAYILSETLFTLLLAVFIYLCLKISLAKEIKYCILAALTFGVLVLTKSIMLGFSLFLFLWVFWFTRSFKKIILTAAVSFVIISPWVYRNHAYFDTFDLRGSIEMSTGEVLFYKVRKLDYKLKDFKEAVVFTISENLGKKIFPEAIDNPRDFLFKEDILVHNKLMPELRARRYTDDEIKRKMIHEIMNRPAKFILISTLDVLKMTQFSYLPTLNQAHIIENFNKITHGSSLLSLLRAAFRSLAYFLILFTIIGILMYRNIWHKWIFLFIVIVYFNLAYSIIYGHGRFSVPIIPYYIILSVPLILKIKDNFTIKV